VSDAAHAGTSMGADSRAFLLRRLGPGHCSARSMIYRRPSLARPRFVFSVVAAGTGAILAGSACGDSMVLPPAADASPDDVTEDVHFSSSGSGSGGGLIDPSGISSSGSAASSTSSGGCTSSSSSGGGCALIVYDAANDAIENLDTGPDQEAAATENSGDGAAEAGDR
jgi:hypothetical protein